MRVVLVGVLGVGACYAPAAPSNVPCSPEEHCPSGQMCIAGVCGGASDPFDAPIDPDGPDASTAAGSDAQACFGIGLVTICPPALPTNDLIAGDLAIDTESSTSCTLVVTSGTVEVCVVMAHDLTLGSGKKITGIGARPLVILATGTLTIDGLVDVASKGNGMIGAASRATCPGSLDGASATQGGAGGAGGAGGSLGTIGGHGGKGSGATVPGAAMLPAEPISLQGGCPGGKGGTGNGGGGAGKAGGGGGVVYLIAGTRIAIAGVVNASGTGGLGGTAGATSGGGGGGGGAGGLIGLDAPSIVVTGQVFANGGGGGGGNGNVNTLNGKPGGEPTSPTVPASGGASGSGGTGVGGVGFAATTQAGVGADTSNTYTGGGGGGGGAGVVVVYGPAPGSIGGSISPAPQ